MFLLAILKRELTTRVNTDRTKCTARYADQHSLTWSRSAKHESSRELVHMERFLLTRAVYYVWARYE